MSTSPKHPRYQDYVIRDGKFIGDFETMYRDFEEPWHQASGAFEAIEKSIGIMLLQRYGCRRPLEFGCGLGYYTDRLRSELGAAAGVDVSKTAIEKARIRHPESIFYLGDILDSVALEDFKPDAIVLAEITWYVLPQLVQFKSRLRERSGLGFLHLLTTYPNGQQTYGRDYFTDLPAIMTFWSDVIDIKEWGIVSRASEPESDFTYMFGLIK